MRQNKEELNYAVRALMFLLVYLFFSLADHAGNNGFLSRVMTRLFPPLFSRDTLCLKNCT